MILSESQKLQIVLASAVAAAELPIMASWADTLADASTFAPNDTLTETNGTIAVDVMAAPAAGSKRQLKYLSVLNADTVDATVTVRVDASGTLTSLARITLPAGYRLEYTYTNGFRVLNADGAIATGATTNSGTVTSVAVADAVGISWTGSPITTSGTFTPTLSTNLQAWSGIDPITKEPTITAGTTAQYWRGNKTWQDFATSVRAAVLTGLSTATNAAIVATDTVLVALGKLQAQVTGKANLAGATFTGEVTFAGGASGSEGAQFNMLKPASGTSLTGNVAVDISGNFLRAFGPNGTAAGIGGVAFDFGGMNGMMTGWHSGNLNPATFAPAVKGALVAMAADQSIPTGVSTEVIFGAATYDDSGYWSSGAPTRLTVPEAGRYRVSFVLSINPSEVGNRLAFVYKNGADFSGKPIQRIYPSGGLDYLSSTSAVVQCNAGDYFTLLINQGSGGALAVRSGLLTWLSIERLT